MTLTLFKGRIKVMSTIASHSPLNISETVRDSLSTKGPPIGNCLWVIKWSCNRWRQARDPNV